jgi:adenine deaminase
MPDIIAGLPQRGLRGGNRLALAADARSATDTLRLGATDHTVRLAIRSGLPPEVAIRRVTFNPARPCRLPASTSIECAVRSATASDSKLISTGRQDPAFVQRRSSPRRSWPSAGPRAGR